MYGGFPVKLTTHIGDAIYPDFLTVDQIREQTLRNMTELIKKNQILPGNILRAIGERFSSENEENILDLIIDSDSKHVHFANEEPIEEEEEEEEIVSTNTQIGITPMIKMDYLKFPEIELATISDISDSGRASDYGSDDEEIIFDAIEMKYQQELSSSRNNTKIIEKSPYLSPRRASTSRRGSVYRAELATTTLDRS